MAFNLVFTTKAMRDLDSLDSDTAKRVVKKLDWFGKQSNPLQFASRLTNDELGQYRFRIGDYRIIFDVDDSDIIILRAGHRSKIYK